jgi:hypothetical protein
MRKVVRERLLTRVPKMTHLAAMLGVPEGNFSYFLSDTRGGTMALAFRVAYLLDCPVEDVLGVPHAPKFVDEHEGRYPTRVLAARAAYLEGVPVEQIESVLTATLRYVDHSGSGDPGAAWWLRMMRSKALSKGGSIKDTTRILERFDAAKAKATARSRVKVSGQKKPSAR